MNLPIKTDLSGKTVVITGGGGILCSMFAKAIARCGANVCILDINEDAAKQIAEEIQKDGFVAKGYKTDVLNSESLTAVRNEISMDFGTCDILINGAGGNNKAATTDDEVFDKEITDIKTFFDLDSGGIDFVFKLNFLGTLLPTQVFARDMIEKKTASVINISSMNAFTPLTKIPAYSGAKAAISNFTQWLAVYFASTGIRVNAIAPGFFVTNQNRALLLNPDGSYTKRSEKILNATPMKRFGEAEELIGTLLFLINDEAASFITGTVIPVDGGFSAYSGV